MNLNLGDTQLIIAECRASGLTKPQTAYVLATAYHETAHTMKPVRETLATSDAQAVARLDAAWAKGQLKWVKTPYWRTDTEGKSWFGRGYVQITHKANYQRLGERIGVNLVGNPSLALEPKIAAKILVRGMVEGLFTTKKLSDYITPAYKDYVNARRIVNGTDKAQEIARLAEQYESALPDVVVKPTVKTTDGFWDKLFAAIFGGKK